MTSPQILIQTHYRNVTETEILQYIVGVSVDTEGCADSKCRSTEIEIVIYASVSKRS